MSHKKNLSGCWNNVCLPKRRGGLGVKNLSLFNMILLSKWKWRYLTEQDAIYGMICWLSNMDYPLIIS